MISGTLVVVGASLAGIRAVEGARRAGFDGDITLIGAESHLPYDRPPLSKAYLYDEAEPAATYLRSAERLRDELRVDLHLDTFATGLDIAGRCVLAADSSFHYEGIVIATGAEARVLPHLAGTGVHVLRSLDDAGHIRQALDAGARTVVVGAGFIGSEVASAARSRNLEVTIVEAQEIGLVGAVGIEVATRLAELHHRHGARLLCQTSIDSISEVAGTKTITLSSGETLEAELVVVGVGAAPMTGWLDNSGLVLDDGIVCDSTLCAGQFGVYAAGDVARWLDPGRGHLVRFEHWTSASEQGALAGRNAVTPEAPVEYTAVPYFWSDWYGDHLQSVGDSVAEEVRFIELGDADRDRWVALYRMGDDVVGAFGLNAANLMMKLRSKIRKQSGWKDALKFVQS